MSNQAPDVELQLGQLQPQLDRLAVSLDKMQETQEHLQPLEGRLSQLLQQSSEILDRLTNTNERHEQAVGDVESRLSEWRAMEAGFRERTKSLDDIFEAAANSVSSIKQAESRLVAIEKELSSDIHAMIAQLRAEAAPRPQALVGGGDSWNLESVVRLHDELRESEGAVLALPPASEPGTALLSGRVESLELAVAAGKQELTHATRRNDQQRRRSLVAVGMLGVVVIAAAALAIGSQRRVEARLTEAAARVTEAQRQAEAASRLASQEVAAARDAAERRVTEAQQTARAAQTVSDVLTAPDLVRFYLPGADRAPRSSAQLLWSRTRGLVLSGSRMPAAPAGTIHHRWLLTNGQPVSAGTFVPDAQGRFSLVTEEAPAVPRRVVGAVVTFEPAAGLPRRSSAAVVSRALVATPPLADTTAP